MKFTLEPASDNKHKWVGVFTDPVTKDERRVSFGAKGMTDYTLSGDKLRRSNYLSRHRSREDWNAPMTAGALSRWILWGDSTSLQTNVRSFKRRFGMGD
jgi:RNA recognition motif-containing protein